MFVARAVFINDLIASETVTPFPTGREFGSVLSSRHTVTAFAASTGDVLFSSAYRVSLAHREPYTICSAPATPWADLNYGLAPNGLSLFFPKPVLFKAESFPVHLLREYPPQATGNPRLPAGQKRGSLGFCGNSLQISLLAGKRREETGLMKNDLGDVLAVTFASPRESDQ